MGCEALINPAERAEHAERISGVRGRSAPPEACGAFAFLLGSREGRHVMETEKTGRPAAFFDFDKTLLSTNSAKLGLWYLWRRGHLSSRFGFSVLVASIFYKQNLISEEAMARYMIRFYKGKTIAPFAAGAEEFYHSVMKPHLAPRLLARARAHKSLGHVLVLLSGSIRYYLEPVARDVGFDHLISTELEEGPGGVLTGRPRVLCVDANKKLLMTKLAEAENLDLSRSSAYGNHQADIPMLSAVGHPYAVEPTRPLRKKAREMGWPILTFR